MNKFRMATLAVAGTCAAITGGAASATDLTGKTLQAAYLYPNASTTIEGPFIAVVGNGIEFTFPNNAISVNVGASTVTITNLAAGGFVPAPFDGLRLTDINSGIADFTGLSFLSRAGSSTFTPVATFDANNLFFNFGGLGSTAFAAGDTVTFSVTTADAVPEPATWAMMLVGFAAIGGAMRRRQRVTMRLALA